MVRSQLFNLADPVTALDHSIGPDDALVTVLEYGDFECSNCKQAAGAVKLLLARFDGRIRFIFRHFPLEEIHFHALHAAEVAECAGGQGKFWQMHDVLFENQPRLKLTNLYDYARSLDLDMGRFTAEMDDEIYLQRVRDDQRSGALSGVRATPTFFVNGGIVDVSFGMQALFEATASELDSRLEKAAFRASPP